MPFQFELRFRDRRVQGEFKNLTGTSNMTKEEGLGKRHRSDDLIMHFVELLNNFYTVSHTTLPLPHCTLVMSPRGYCTCCPLLLECSSPRLYRSWIPPLFYYLLSPRGVTVFHGTDTIWVSAKIIENSTNHQDLLCFPAQISH